MVFVRTLLALCLASGTLCAAHTVTVSPSVVASSGDSVNVSYTLDTELNGANDTMLAFYAPHDSPQESFIGYFNLTGHTGADSKIIDLVNMRSDVEFRLLSVPRLKTLEDSFHSAEELAASNMVSFANPNEPTFGHLAVTADPTEMRVMWTTRDALNDSVVQWSSTPGSYGASASAVHLTYTAADMCGSPANSSVGWREPGYLNDAVMTSLVAGKRYYYRYGSDTAGWSAEHTFIAHPGVGADIATNAIVFGDMGTWADYATYLRLQPASVGVMNHVFADINASDTPWYVAHIGDISYARGYAYLWDNFFQQIERVSTSAPYMVCMGNHEYDWPSVGWHPTWGDYGSDSGGECGVPYNARFHMPGAAGVENLWYGTDWGNVHFTTFSTEHNFTKGSPQYDFIAQDLAAVNRSKTPWLVLLGHRPMYTSTQHASQAEDLRAALEPLLTEYHVDLALWGHVHDYERFCGLVNYKCGEKDEDGTVHAVVGMAGNDYQVDWVSEGGYVHVQPDNVVFRSMNFGYSRIRTTETTLTFEYAGMVRGTIHDTLTLDKANSQH